MSPGKTQLDVLYTNADGLINKKDELILRIKNSSSPQIIIVTEVKGIKNALTPCSYDLRVPLPFHYELSVSHLGNGKRGIAIYYYTCVKK